MTESPYFSWPYFHIIQVYVKFFVRKRTVQLDGMHAYQHIIYSLSIYSKKGHLKILILFWQPEFCLHRNRSIRRVISVVDFSSDSQFSFARGGIKQSAMELEDVTKIIIMLWFFRKPKKHNFCHYHSTCKLQKQLYFKLEIIMLISESYFN